MVVGCSVKGCSHKSTKNSTLSFHKFPTDEQILEEWLNVLRADNWQPTKTSKICSAHFTQSDFYPDTRYNRLRHTAIPSQHLFPIATINQSTNSPNDDPSTIIDQDCDDSSGHRKIICCPGDDCENQHEHDNISQDKDSNNLISPISTAELLSTINENENENENIVNIADSNTERIECITNVNENNSNLIDYILSFPIVNYPDDTVNCRKCEETADYMIQAAKRIKILEDENTLLRIQIATHCCVEPNRTDAVNGI